MIITVRCHCWAICVALTVLTVPSRAAVNQALALLITSSNTNSQTAASTMTSLFGDPAVYASRLPKNASAATESNLIGGLQTQSTHYDFYSHVTSDYRTQTAYYSNNYRQSLDWAMYIYGNSSTETYISALFPIKAVSFDWVSKNLYWSSAASIAVTKVTGDPTYTIVLIPSMSNTATDLAVDPLDAFLFWCESGAIKRTSLTGSGVTTIFADSTLVPTDIAIDFTSSPTQLYYLTASSRLGAMQLDGSSPLHWELASSYSAFAIYKNIVMLGDSQNFVVTYGNRSMSSFNLLSTLNFGATDHISDMAIFSAASQPTISSPCTNNNGGCSQLCYTVSSSSRVCGCGTAYALNSDGVTCTAVAGQTQTPPEGKGVSGHQLTGLPTAWLVVAATVVAFCANTAAAQ
jgi:hypothetical protein